MRTKRFLIYYVVLILALSCSRRPQHQPSSLTVIDDELMMVGPVYYQDILDQFPEWRDAHNEAEIKEETVNDLRQIEEPLAIQCFLGTWCSDSYTGVPPFMKAVKKSQNSNIKVELIALDRRRDDPDHLGPKNAIELVPTFIVKRDGVELFRMIEFPQSTFAEDLIRESSVHQPIRQSRKDEKLKM